MKNNYLSLGMLAFAVFFAQFSFAQTDEQKLQLTQSYDKAKLSAIEVSFGDKAQAEKEEAVRMAAQQGWALQIQTQDGRFQELQKVVNGKPIYYTTFNVDAARSTRTNHLNSGGSLGLSLMGQNMTAHVWDGGIARASHQEYDGAGGSNRFTAMDSGSLNFHAAHVTGTIIASGVVADAKGMAPHAKARGYDWNSDKSEATSEASSGMLVSNHSYGFATRNQFGQVQLPQYYFGGYITESRDWDQIMFNAPNYLMVVAAGNDGNDNTANNNPTGGSGFDKLTGHSTSKNNLVVANAQDANVDASGNLISVSINSSSSEGPTDDFRIKPDITGNGTGVYSTYHNSNTAYNSISGTSMASPNVAGSVLLLQQHYNNTNGSFARAATIKGIVLHTADDAGASGPDAVFGWGLMNAKRAAETITNDGGASKVEQLTLSSGQSYTVTVDSDGVSPLLASISWTDRPGTATTTVNSTTPVLVNDLDIRVTKGGTTYLPYELTGATSSTKRDNNVDPFERVDISGASGTYTITVTHKGSLVGGSQAFSLVVTGLTGTAPTCNATTPTGVSTSNVTSNSASVSWNSVAGATYDVRFRETGTSSWTTGNVTSNSASLTGLSASTTYEVQVRSVCPSGNSSYSSSVTFTTSGGGSSNCASLPYSEGFESGDGWTQVGGDDGNWHRTSGSTPSSGTGPSAAAQGTNYLFLEASTNNSPGQIGNNATAILESDCFDLSGETAATFSFKNHMYGNNVGTLTVQASTNGSSFTNIWTDSGNKGNQWNDVSIDLSSYVGGQVTFRIVGTTGNGWSSDIAIDDIAITAGGSSTPVTYCDSSGSRTTYEWIDYVALGGMTNSTGASSGYADYTNLTANVARGSSNTITISAGFSGTAYTEYWNVWIDFNNDGTFDSGENVASGSSSSAGNLTATFTVPSNAALGDTRMRVSMKYNAAATACENFGDGEVEDYTVNISNSTANYTTFSDPIAGDQLGNEGGIFDFTVYPNPVRGGILTVRLADTRATTYAIKNMLGQTVKASELMNNSIRVDDLSNGMYILEVSDGQKSITKKFIKQ
jgi:hypothetical protein